MQRSSTRPSPRLETLEDRTCPTTISISESGDILRIQGDRVGFKGFMTATQDDSVTILQNDSLNTLTVTVNDSSVKPGTVTRTYTSSQFRRIEIDLDNGSDSVEYHLVSNHTRAKEIDVETGSGADRVVLNMGQVLYSPAGLPTSAAGKIQAGLDIDVDAGSEPDRVWVDVGTVEGLKLATVSVYVDLDSGNDELNAGLWGDLTRANVSFVADGESGDDIMRFAGRWHPSTGTEFWLRIDAASSLTVDMDGGSGRDLVRANLINDLRGWLSVRLDGGWNDDNSLAADGVSLAGVSASITLLPSSTGTLDAQLYGGGGDGNDAMGFELSNQGNAFIANALLDGGDGRDTFLSPPSPGVRVVSVS